MIIAPSFRSHHHRCTKGLRKPKARQPRMSHLVASCKHRVGSITNQLRVQSRQASTRTRFAAVSSTSSSSGHLWMEPIHVLGAGSVGLLVAASLRVAFPSYPIRLLLREHHQVKLGQDRPDVLVNLIQNRRLRTVKVPSQIISSNFTPKRKWKHVLLATKAYQAVEALDSIRHSLKFGVGSSDDDDDDRTQIVLLCNGAMAARDDILAHFADLDPENLHMALTTHGAYRELGANSETTHDSTNYYDEETSATEESYPSLMMDVVHAGQGRLDFPSTLAAWTPLFDRAGLQAHTLTNEEMQGQLWCKLAANCLINPLTSIYQCTNGKVVDCPEWEHMLNAIPQEVAQVAQCRSGADATDVQASVLREFCVQVVASTQENRSSMLQDVTAKRRTEIDALNGYIVRLGEENDIFVPANRDLYKRILELSKG